MSRESELWPGFIDPDTSLCNRWQLECFLRRNRCSRNTKLLVHLEERGFGDDGCIAVCQELRRVISIPSGTQQQDLSVTAWWRCVQIHTVLMVGRARAQLHTEDLCTVQCLFMYKLRLTDRAMPAVHNTAPTCNRIGKKLTKILTGTKTWCQAGCYCCEPLSQRSYVTVSMQVADLVVAHGGSIRELHLSHNRLSDAGAEALLATALLDLYPVECNSKRGSGSKDYMPLFVRLEHNQGVRGRIPSIREWVRTSTSAPTCTMSLVQQRMC